MKRKDIVVGDVLWYERSKYSGGVPVQVVAAEPWVERHGSAFHSRSLKSVPVEASLPERVVRGGYSFPATEVRTETKAYRPADDDYDSRTGVLVRRYTKSDTGGEGEQQFAVVQLDRLKGQYDELAEADAAEKAAEAEAARRAAAERAQADARRDEVTTRLEAIGIRPHYAYHHQPNSLVLSVSDVARLLDMADELTLRSAAS